MHKEMELLISLWEPETETWLGEPRRLGADIGPGGWFATELSARDAGLLAAILHGTAADTATTTAIKTRWSHDVAWSKRITFTTSG